MISFRFHLVSLVAVFLALGLGVLTGTTVLNRGIVAQLESNTDRLSRDLEQVRTSVDRLQSEAEVWSAFGEAAMAPLLSGRLAGQSVVIVTQEGTDGTMLAGVRRALEAAGAEAAALLSVSGRMALQSDADRQALATAVGLDPTLDPGTLAAETASLLGTRLAQGENGTEILESLLAADFLLVQGAGLGESGLRTLGGPDQIVAVVAGGPAPSQVLPEEFLIPMIAALVDGAVPVAAAEPAIGEEREPPFVTLLRSDGELAGRVATQDNADQLPGQVSFAVAVEQLLGGTAGHFGVKDGATAPMPDLT